MTGVSPVRFCALGQKATQCVAILLSHVVDGILQVGSTFEGGVESMEQFRRWWFPATGEDSFYCRFDNKPLQAYSAVMHFTGAISSLFASYFTQQWGRKG